MFRFCLCILKGSSITPLGNKLRSSLKCIQLLSIAKYEIICTHGVEALLKPIVDDVLKLEQVSYSK